MERRRSGSGTYSRPPTSHEAVLREIRQAIMTRRLNPGERVRQWDLARRLNVSSVPVREALKTLEAEGQVTYEPHRGYRVVELSVRELEEIYLIRQLLEAEATRWAVPRVDAGLIRRLEALVDGMDECVEAGDIVRYTELNRDFHLLLFERADLPRLYHMIEVLWQSSEAYRSVIFNPAWCERAQADHRAILGVCEAGDVAAAIAAQDEHRARGLASITAHLKGT
jgi:DNA-binding GntR family transcriptional regulator